MPHLHSQIHSNQPPLIITHHHRHPTRTVTSLIQRCLPVTTKSSPLSIFSPSTVGLRIPAQSFPPRAIIRCMANPRRVQMVAKQIMRELSDMLITDNVLQCAVWPEAALGADMYLSSLTTISDVEVSSDLQVAKVYVSVFGDERGKDVAISGLKSKARYVRAQLGRRMKLRLTPEIRFIEDESIERGSRVIAILDRLKEESESSNRTKDKEDQEDDDPDDDDDDDDDDDEDEDEEGIIYVE
ncbi:hypothetical protein LguiB_022324 [Lonicera macranthoides]